MLMISSHPTMTQSVQPNIRGSGRDTDTGQGGRCGTTVQTSGSSVALSMEGGRQ